MTSSFIWRRQALKFAALALCAAPFAVPAQTPSAPIRLALIESMSGPFANTGEAVFRNLLWAVERVNARGGVKLPGGARPLQLDRYDSKGQNEEALSALRAAMDDGARIDALDRPQQVAEHRLARVREGPAHAFDQCKTDGRGRHGRGLRKRGEGARA